MKFYNILNMTIKEYFANLYIYSYDFNNEIIIQNYIYRKIYKYMWKFETIYSMEKIYRKFIMFKKKLIDTYIL